MFQKIQPQQIYLHTFSSPSGDLSFVQGESTVRVNLQRTLSGDFSITGSLRVNGGQIAGSETSNVVNGVRNYIFGGQNNTIDGTGNAILNSEDSSVNGFNNLDLNGDHSSFGAGSRYNTVLAGNLATIPANTTGAVVLADSTTNDHTAVSNDSLLVSFESGVFFKDGAVEMRDSLNLYGGLKMDASSSGLFSGNINVLGTYYSSGIRLPSASDYSSLSGNVNSLSSGLNTVSGNVVIVSGITTGLDARIDILEAAAPVGSPVFLTGTQTISGKKTFANQLFAPTGFFLAGDSGIFKSVGPPASQTDTSGLFGQVEFDLSSPASRLYMCLGNGSGWRMWESVNTPW